MKSSNMAAAGVGRITVKNSALFLCDMQEKFRKTISFYPQIIAVSSRMLAASKILKIPVIVTEQYPKGAQHEIIMMDGYMSCRAVDMSCRAVETLCSTCPSCPVGLRTSLGPTVSELDVSECPVFPKMKFSMAIPEVMDHLKQFPDVNNIMLCGIESHVCVQSTAFEFIEKGFNVHVIVDAGSSRSMVDRMYAFERMKQAGAFLTTSESALLGLCCGSDHPDFRDIQKIIRDSAPDSGLLHHTIKGETPV